MDEIKLFLQSSTIHGLTYISDHRILVKLFWIVTVIGGFSTSGTVVLKGKHQKKNVSNNPSMDSFTKIYIDSEKL